MKTKIYYSIQNGGDGSAYPKFLESAELAEWDQDHMYEGWGESCCGSLEIESDGPIECYDTQSTVEYYFERFDDDEDEGLTAEFLEEFFPGGFPRVTVECSESRRRYNIMVDGAKVGDRFAYPEEVPTEAKRSALQAELNGDMPPLTDEQRRNLEKTLSGGISKGTRRS